MYPCWLIGGLSCFGEISWAFTLFQNNLGLSENNSRQQHVRNMDTSDLKCMFGWSFRTSVWKLLNNLKQKQTDPKSADMHTLGQTCFVGKLMFLHGLL